MPQFLFGPTDDPEFAQRFLPTTTDENAWITFGGACESWEAARAGQSVDALLVWMSYTSVPAWVWNAPVPVIALAPDANLLWSRYRHSLPCADLVLTDAPTVARFQAAGLEHVREANLFGLDRLFSAALDEPEVERDIDLLFVGNLHPAVQGARLSWLGRVAQLGQKFKVVIASGVFGADYLALMKRAKLVFNRSVRGECNLRALEAAASGAVLLQEAENEEVREYLDPQYEYVTYTHENFESVVESLLADDARRKSIAEAARDAARWRKFATLIRVGVGVGGKGWSSVLERAAQRKRERRVVPLTGRVWQRASVAHRNNDSTLLADLATANDHHSRGALAQSAAEAEPHFRKAASAGNRVSMVCHAFALAELGQREEAGQVARGVVSAIEAKPELSRGEADSVLFPIRFDHFRVSWERAGYDHAGNATAELRAKATILRAQACVLIATLTEAVTDWEAAVACGVDWPHVRAALGRALLNAGRADEAVPQLRHAVEHNPFDNPAALLLVHALQMTAPDAARDFLAHRAIQARSAPGLIAPIEPPRSLTETPVAEVKAEVKVKPEAEQKAEPAVVNEPVVVAGAKPLVSIVILCCNELEVTRLCLESVLTHTRAPFELILIDNGSTDGTAEYLHTIARREEPERVIIAQNRQNRGYPAGVNQAIPAATGSFILLLNNDVVVTPHWLDQLLACAERDPRLGLVGATTNYAPPPQLVEPAYNSLRELDAFAQERATRFAGQSLATLRVTGFCMLVRREVFERVGLLDESFGLGFFDDDDLCLRARNAGFALAVALDCYVHHFGSQTFRALGVNLAEQLEENLLRYQAKWGEAEAAKYTRPTPPPAQATPRGAETTPFMPAITLRDEHEPHVVFPTPTPRIPAAVPQIVGRKPRVSLTMIVKNEEHNLEACLASVRDLVDEAVVIDTGSTDRTRDIARAFDCVVGEFPWIDHFAAARNAALDHATGDYAFWMDADDRLDEPNRAKLRALFAQLTGGNEAFVMKCLCVSDQPGAGATAVDHVRLFRLHESHRWTYRVHEQILPSLRATGANVQWSDVCVQHVGYINPAVRSRKLQRDLRLLKLDAEEKPHDPFTLFNLGSVYHESGDYAGAIDALERSLAGSHVQDSIVRKIYALLVRCHHQSGSRVRAEAVCRTGRQHYPEDAELLFLAAGLARESGDFGAAEALYRKLIDGRESPHFASVDTGLRVVKGRHNLAVMLFEQGRVAEAEVQWRSTLVTDPQFLPAILGLGELHIKSRNAVGVQTQLAALRMLGTSGESEAAALEGRWLLAQGELVGAARILEEAAIRDPQSVSVRVALSHVRLADGSPPEVLEPAFRAILALEPHNAQAQHNLNVLLRQTNRWIEGIEG